MVSNGILVSKEILCGNKACGPRSWTWDVPLVIGTEQRHLLNYAVLILNRPITQSEIFMRQFWNNASIRVTVDGGTNKWDSYLETLSRETQELMKLPDIVCGDFDSITKETLQKYKQKGCKTVHTPDQNHTDFTKALIEVQKYSRERHIEICHVIAFGQNSGRLDQTLGNLQTLFLVKEKNLLSSKTKVYLMSDDSISWLLVPGDHCIIIPEETRKHKRAWCSLVPLGEACESVTTTGLKWNLDKQPLKFGELVSTSNTFDGSERVTVNCSHTVLWSMRIPSIGSKLISFTTRGRFITKANVSKQIHVFSYVAIILICNFPEIPLYNPVTTTEIDGIFSISIKASPQVLTTAPRIKNPQQRYGLLIPLTRWADDVVKLEILQEMNDDN